MLQILGMGELPDLGFYEDLYGGYRDELEAAVVHERDIVAWLVVMGMHREESVKGHSTG